MKNGLILIKDLRVTKLFQDAKVQLGTAWFSVQILP